MKKLIFTVFIFSSFLFSSTDFEKGETLFKSGNYREAFELFKDLSKDGGNSEKIDFYLGRSAFEVGEYNEALFAFERILIEADEREKVKINRVKLELGRVHLALGEKDSAKNLFNEVLNDNPPEDVKVNIISLLDSLHKAKKNWNLSLFANIEFGFEENINSQPSNNEMRDYINNNDLTLEDQIDSGYASETASINYGYIFGDSSFLVNSSLFGFNQNYFEKSDFDIQYLALALSPTYKSDKVKFEIPLKAENVQYGGEHLLNAYSVGLKGSRYIETEIVKAILFDIFTNYKKKSYSDKNSKENDSSIFEYGLSATFKYKENRFSLRYSTELESSKKSPTINANQTDKTINSFRMKYEREKLLEKVDFSLSYMFKNIVYDDYEAFKAINPKVSDGCRLDRYHNFRINFSREFFENFSGNIAFNYIINSSNHVPADYDKYIANIGFGYLF